MTLEVRIPIHGFVVLRIDAQRPLSEEEAIAMARSEDAYPDLRTGVLEYAWEDASVYEVATTPVH